MNNKDEIKDEVVTQYNKGFFGKIRGFFGSIPGLVFLIGCALVFCGILFQVGYFDTSDTPTPSTTNETSNDTSNADTSDDTTEYIDGSATEETVMSDGVPMKFISGITYTYGDFSIIASDLNSLCTENGTNCNLITNSVTLQFTGSGGEVVTYTLTPTENSVQAGIGTIQAVEWGEQFVNIQIN